MKRLNIIHLTPIPSNLTQNDFIFSKSRDSQVVLIERRDKSQGLYLNFDPDEGIDAHYYFSPHDGVSRGDVELIPSPRLPPERIRGQKGWALWWSILEPPPRQGCKIMLDRYLSPLVKWFFSELTEEQSVRLGRLLVT